MKKQIIYIIGLIVIAGVALAVLLNNSKTEQMISNEKMVTENNMMKNDDSNMIIDDKSDQTMLQTPGVYKDYSTETVEAEQAVGNKVVLFFHASWCPFCKAADMAFLEKSTEIPSGVTVLKTDYDSNTVLKQKYGVTYQHTFVQIDNNGNLISKWNGGDIDNLNKNIK